MNRLAWCGGKWNVSSAGWRWGGAWVTWFVVVLAVVAVAERVAFSALCGGFSQGKCVTRRGNRYSFDQAKGMKSISTHSDFVGY